MAYKLNSTGSESSLYGTSRGSTWHDTAIKKSHSQLHIQPHYHSFMSIFDVWSQFDICLIIYKSSYISMHGHSKWMHKFDKELHNNFCMFSWASITLGIESMHFFLSRWIFTVLSYMDLFKFCICIQNKWISHLKW